MAKWILFIILAVLFIPIPFYISSDKAVCLGIDICPKQGWNFGPSLWQKISIDKTANWKTYTNKKHNYLLKYPQDWEVKWLAGDVGSTIDDADLIELSSSIEQDHTFEVVSLKSGVFTSWSIEEFSKQVDKFGWRGNPIISKGEITLGGFQALRYTTKEIIGVRVIKSTTENKVYVYDVSLQGEKPKPQTIKIFNTILSTFKLTDQTDTANWKTYIDSNFGYSFKYPADYKPYVKNDNVFYSSDAKFDKITTAKTSGIDIGSTVYGPGEDTQEYIGPNTKMDSILSSKLVLPSGLIAKAYVNLEDITVTIDYKKSNKNMRLILWCGGEKGNSSGCENVLTPLLSTFKFIDETNTEAKF